MKRYIIVLPNGKEIVFYGDDRAALLFARAHGGAVKEIETAGAQDPDGAPPAAEGAEAQEEEGTKSRKKR